jgi:hypothetical protein
VVPGVVEEVAQDPVEAGDRTPPPPRPRQESRRPGGATHDCRHDAPEVDRLELGCSASASKREISISSSTSTRSRRMSATRARARRASGVIPAVPLSISDASPTSAVSGVGELVRDVRDEPPVLLLRVSSRPTVVSSVAAIRLNSAPSAELVVPAFGHPCGEVAPAIVRAARAAASTGRRMPARSIRR